jgi:hypothetical protein
MLSSFLRILLLSSPTASGTVTVSLRVRVLYSDSESESRRCGRALAQVSLLPQLASEFNRYYLKKQANMQTRLRVGLGVLLVRLGANLNILRGTKQCRAPPASLNLKSQALSASALHWQVSESLAVPVAPLALAT